MNICVKCGKSIPRKIWHNGKDISLAKRKYCIECSPVGERRIWGGKEISKNRINGKRKILEPIDHICKVCEKDLNKGDKYNKESFERYINQKIEHMENE